MASHISVSLWYAEREGSTDRGRASLQLGAREVASSSEPLTRTGSGQRRWTSSTGTGTQHNGLDLSERGRRRLCLAQARRSLLPPFPFPPSPVRRAKKARSHEQRKSDRRPARPPPGEREFFDSFFLALYSGQARPGQCYHCCNLLICS